MSRFVAVCCAVLLLGAGSARAQPAGGGPAPAQLPPPTELPYAIATVPQPGNPPVVDCACPPSALMPLPEPPAQSPNPIAVLGQKLEAVASRLSVLTADENFKVVVFGALQGNMIFSTARPVAPGIPLFLVPGPLEGFRQQTVDLHARSSSLGAAVVGPKIGDWQTGGLILALFYNDNLIADRYGVLPFQIWGDLKNDDWRFTFGLQTDLINPVNPTMLTFSLLAFSGNAGSNFRGQFRFERFLHLDDDAKVTLQLALSEPNSTIVSNALRIDEDNGWPSVETRVALTLGPTEGAGLAAEPHFEVGLSGVIGQVRRTEPPGVRQVVADLWALGVDGRWRVCPCFGLKGELYVGQAIGTYNAGVQQSINFPAGREVRAAGGWGEVYYYLVPDKVHTHWGFGLDDPLDRDVPLGGILRNHTYFGNVIWDVTKNFRLGFEATWRETAYDLLRDNEGATFHTQVQLSF
jgi:hypothetical protein